MRKRCKRKKQKKIIITSMVALVFLFSVGYAAFSSEFLISGKGTIVMTAAAEKLKETIVTSGDGLYEDVYEEGRYVYKGASPDNYITFNNEEAGWRIISIETDGTIKIMRNSSIGQMAWDNANVREYGSNGLGGTYCFNNATSGYGCNAWGKYDNFVNGSLSGTVLLDASLNTYLNGTYKTSLATQSYIQEKTYGVGPVEHQNEDLAKQIVDEKSITWTGNIGLMSLSDYIKSNLNTAECGNLKLSITNYDNCEGTTWMQDAVTSTSEEENAWLWTITPVYNQAIYVFHVDIWGGVGFFSAYDSRDGVAPALYLKSNITLLGNGTHTNPYRIAQN